MSLSLGTRTLLSVQNKGEHFNDKEISKEPTSLPLKQNIKAVAVSIVPEHRDTSSNHKLGLCLVPALNIINIQFRAQNALVSIINDEDILIKISLWEFKLY